MQEKKEEFLIEQCIANIEKILDIKIDSRYKNLFFLEPEKKELMEFIGDSAFNLAVTLFLTKSFHFKSEGVFTVIRSVIVRTSGIIVLGKKIGLEKFYNILKLYKKINISKIRWIEETFEALIGCLVLSYNIEKVLEKIFIILKKCFLDIVADIETVMDAITTLQIFCQCFNKTLPKYEKQKIKQNYFKVIVSFNGKNSHGFGSNIKTAKQIAAQNLLKKLNVNAKTIFLKNYIENNL